jgi:hypothetical protein
MSETHKIAAILVVDVAN